MPPPSDPRADEAMGMIMQGSSVSQAPKTCGLVANQARYVRIRVNRLKESNSAKESRLAASSEMWRDKYALAKQSTLTAQSLKKPKSRFGSHGTRKLP